MVKITKKILLGYILQNYKFKYSSKLKKYFVKTPSGKVKSIPVSKFDYEAKKRLKNKKDKWVTKKELANIPRGVY